MMLKQVSENTRQHRLEINDIVILYIISPISNIQMVLDMYVQYGPYSPFAYRTHVIDSQPKNYRKKCIVVTK